MSIWQSFKKWALKPTPLPHEAVEPEPFWKRDPCIGEPVKAMLLAFEKCPARFKFKAEYIAVMNTVRWRGTVTDSITGEKFAYSGDTRVIHHRCDTFTWTPMIPRQCEWLLRDPAGMYTYSNVTVDVHWMTPREKSHVRSVVMNSLRDRHVWVEARRMRQILKLEAEQEKAAAIANQAERNRLIEIYKGE